MQEDLRHVDEHHDDHAGAGVVVERPQEPAERLLVIEVEQAVVGLVGGRHVDERQADAGDDLQAEERHGRAAENVPPAHRPGGAARDGVLHHVQQGVAQPEPGFQPRPDGTQRAHHKALAKRKR